MSDERDDEVKMTSLRPHTYDGIPRPVGTQYLARALDVQTLRLQSMAIESDLIAPEPPPDGTGRAPS